jgi:hypothetical protein
MSSAAGPRQIEKTTFPRSFTNIPFCPKRKTAFMDIEKGILYTQEAQLYYGLALVL